VTPFLFLVLIKFNHDTNYVIYSYLACEIKIPFLTKTVGLEFPLLHNLILQDHLFTLFASILSFSLLNQKLFGKIL
jgi:hypothetical protein